MIPLNQLGVGFVSQKKKKLGVGFDLFPVNLQNISCLDELDFESIFCGLIYFFEIQCY